MTGSLALILSLGVGAFVTGYVGRLEQRIADAAAGQRAERRGPAPVVGAAGARTRGRAPPHRARTARRSRPGPHGGQDAAGGRQACPASRASRRHRRSPERRGCRAPVGAAALAPAASPDARGHGPGAGPRLGPSGRLRRSHGHHATALEHAGMDDRPAAATEICLFRIVQEATTNIAKHAAATACHAYLQRLSSVRGADRRRRRARFCRSRRGCGRRPGPGPARHQGTRGGCPRHVQAGNGARPGDAALGGTAGHQPAAAAPAARATGQAATPPAAQPEKDTRWSVFCWRMIIRWCVRASGEFSRSTRTGRWSPKPATGATPCV
ncbi:MAG: hypothetical protein MZV63_16800 [Marinilabiliales bacterium]|nr:hypothetical protein [Marinilabiliales bacterium]